jgi:hypothetical protein
MSLRKSTVRKGKGVEFASFCLCYALSALITGAAVCKQRCQGVAWLRSGSPGWAVASCTRAKTRYYERADFQVWLTELHMAIQKSVSVLMYLVEPGFLLLWSAQAGFQPNVQTLELIGI